MVADMSDYMTAVEGIGRMMELVTDPMTAFNKKNYETAFNSFYQQMIPAFDAVERLYTSVMEPDTMLENMASALVESAAAKMEQKGRRGREVERMNQDMVLAVFVYPAILNYQGKSSQPLADIIGLKWKEAFPKSNVSQATVDTIQAGFKRKFCYITTAVCTVLGRPDDCYELNLLRGYRDGYMASLEDGETLIRSYYDVAPTIVKHIDQCGNSEEIYRQIYEDWLKPCICMIEEDRPGDCLDKYRGMVEQLKQAYFWRPVSE